MLLLVLKFVCLVLRFLFFSFLFTSTPPLSSQPASHNSYLEHLGLRVTIRL